MKNLLNKYYSWRNTRANRLKTFSVLEKLNIPYYLSDELINLKFKGLNIKLRPYPSSDLTVFKQVFIEEEYRNLIDIVKLNLKDLSILNFENLNIVDAGSNVGFFALYVYNEFKSSSITCIEPDFNNFELLKLNTEGLNFNLKNKALLSEEGLNVKISSSFRDGRDWSKNVVISEVEESSVKSVSISKIISQNKWEIIDVLKIDIEGSEKEIFKSNNLDFLNNIKIIAIEIHEEIIAREEIYTVLKKYNFIIYNFKETTFGVNKKFLL